MPLTSVFISPMRRARRGAICPLTAVSAEFHDFSEDSVPSPGLDEDAKSFCDTLAQYTALKTCEKAPSSADRAYTMAASLPPLGKPLPGSDQSPKRRGWSWIFFSRSSKPVTEVPPRPRSAPLPGTGTARQRQSPKANAWALPE
eukprot:EG_transcript_40184